MKITGWADELWVCRTFKRRRRYCKKLYRRCGKEPGWVLCSPGEILLAERIVEYARRDGLRKLPWFWDKTFDVGWGVQERAWWVLNGYWHDIKYGSDLSKIF